MIVPQRWGVDTAMSGKRNGPAADSKAEHQRKRARPHFFRKPRFPEPFDDVSSEIQTIAAEEWRGAFQGKPIEGKSPKLAIVLKVYRRFVDVAEPQRALYVLDEQLYLQLYLWPQFRALSAASREEGGDLDLQLLHPLILSLVALFNHRYELHPTRASDVLDEFDADAEAVRDLVGALFHLDLGELNRAERCNRLSFLTHLFRSLDHESVSRALLPLLSLPVWVHLSEQACEEQLRQFPYLRKSLSKLRRKAVRSPKASAAKLPQTAVFSLITELEVEVGRAFFNPAEDTLRVICCLVTLLSELLSQIRLRRTLLPLLSDRATLSILQGFSLETESQGHCHGLPTWPRWEHTLELFKFYANFPLDPVTDKRVTLDQIRAEKAKRLLSLQRAVHVIVQRQNLGPSHPLRLLSMASHQEVGNAKRISVAFAECEMGTLLEVLRALKLTRLCPVLGRAASSIRNDSEEVKQMTRTVARHAMGSFCGIQNDFLSGFRVAPVMISERELWSDRDGLASEALPVLNLEFLNVQDYLIRNFTLYRWESAWAIREDIEDALQRVQPSFESGELKFEGWAKMAASVINVKVTHIGQQRMDFAAPSQVNVEVSIDLSRLPNHARAEWHDVQPGDVLFLLRVHVPENRPQPLNAGIAQHNDWTVLLPYCCVRGFVVSHGDEKRENDFDRGTKGVSTPKSKTMITLSGFVDCLQYYYDIKAEKDSGIPPLCGYNLIVRRRPQVNNFFSVLSSLRDLIISPDTVLPEWLEGIVLGRSIAPQCDADDKRREEILDTVDTFISEDHLRSSFPSVPVTIDKQEASDSHFRGQQVYYKLKLAFFDGKLQAVEGKPYSASLVREASGVLDSGARQSNRIAFNRNQVDAICTAMGSGITLIAGPPGTGKTSCIVQIASILYHTKPQERVLVVTRSNHALNDVVEKLVHRGVDPLQVLRLGRGESELSVEEPLSKGGRIDALLRRRLQLLELVDQLSKSFEFGLASETTWTCESANAFYLHSVDFQWQKFCQREDQNWGTFPFRRFFDKLAGQGLVRQPYADRNELNGECGIAARKAYEFIKSIFGDLQSLRFLEVLRTTRPRGNYLVTYHSRVIAMTAVHAAMQRAELLSQCFSYDTLIMEEAAECLEIETFICCLLQRSKRLKRVVLVGDQNQLPPVVQDCQMQQKANFAQSFFARLLRLGNRVVNLDCQGRCRPSIGNLFRWRYPGLRDLSFVVEDPSFSRANPGFLYTSQFVDTGEVSSESQPLPHFYQNVAEAEYVAFTFLYMRLLGYPCESIAVLTTYNGQVQLLREVISSRSAQFGNIGAPAIISTVDKFQGRQADYVLLSLVRSRNIGHFEDIRRITVAVSRARYGLYMFGFLSLFSSSAAFEPVLAHLNERRNLVLVASETFTNARRQESDFGNAKSLAVREVLSPADMAQIVQHLHRSGKDTSG